MATEHFTVIALPYSLSPNADYHVSLFISPDLVPNGPEGKLADFRHFPLWAEVLRNRTEIELADQRGMIAVQPLFDGLSPEAWTAIFPGSTPVRGFTPPELSTRHWRTFRAAELHGAAKLMHLMAMFSDPISPPVPSLHPLSGMMGRLGVKDPRRGHYSEKDITRVLDVEIGELGQESIPLAEIEQRIGAQQDPLRKLALELHRARRFYERPETAPAYRERPKQGATSERPPRKIPDFHERCSLVGDHPSLQRKLGLVVDLKVRNPARLSRSRWLSARIVPQRDKKACRTARTRCEAADLDLVTVAGTEDWDRERLRVGDPSRFVLLDMDPDGTALKLDRYIWTIPRLMMVEANGDPVHAAPTALRSIGFTVTRNRKGLRTQKRLVRQDGLKKLLDQGGAPLLETEDVTQGLRVEVWDDTVKKWFTLHARRITAEAHGHGKVLENLLEDGFIQGTTVTESPNVQNSPVHVHESVFGWEGWSLGAARPGKRVRHHEGKEMVEEPDADPEQLTPLLVSSKAEPGTLPRLRYGRSYAFRAWAVDLAGNSRPHALGPVSRPGSGAINALSTALTRRPRAVEADEHLAAALKSETAASAHRRRRSPAAETTVEEMVTEFKLFSEPDVNRVVLNRLHARRTPGGEKPSGPITADRSTLVVRAFDEFAIAEDQPLLATTASADPSAIAHTIADRLGIEPGRLPKALDTVTPLRPFLRWDPVQPPTIVSRHRFSAGESLRQLVIRSGVTQDPETLEITVTPPVTYAADYAALGYRATSERHLVPPKTSQSEAELHGAFDQAIGSMDPLDHKKLLGVALREAGTLFDMDVPRLDDPVHRDPQPGIALVTGTGVQHVDPMQLPLAPEEMPAPGQYVIHDTDDLVLPYLPDVVARGLSLQFQEAGRDRQIPFPFGSEGFTARYQADWPTRRPFRLVLSGSTQLDGELKGTVINIGLAAGDVQKFRLSSSLDRKDLDLFGLWRSLPGVIRQNPEIREAAADGWLWSLTPFEDVTLVHAVPRPLEAPRSTSLRPMRIAEGSTDVALIGAVDVHGPSSESLTAEAEWMDPVDDLSLPQWDERRQKAVAFTTTIRPEEDLAVLYMGTEDVKVHIPNFGSVWAHKAIHQLGDTKHHKIRYRFRAPTRFREYFDAASLAPAQGSPADPEQPLDDGQSVVGPAVEVSVPSSAKPAAPIVHSVLPLFRWDEGTEPEQPLAVRRRRRAGVRIYLERPWFSSGENELLGILLAPNAIDEHLEGLVSQWGADPVWLSSPVHLRPMTVQLGNLLHAFGVDDRPGDAQPVVPPAMLPLVVAEGGGHSGKKARVLGYRPQYNSDRQKWYVDVSIDPRDTFWPFVRLAVARYQPNSIPGCHLSATTLCDYVQLTPERTTSVSRTDVRHVRVVVSGPVGIRSVRSGLLGIIEVDSSFPATVPDLAQRVTANRLVVARLQRRDPAIPTDLGWDTVTAVELKVRGQGRTHYEAAWVGELAAPEDIPLRRPGENPNWRITVEEWERLPGDPDDLGETTPFMLAQPPAVWEQRLIYAEEIGL